MSESMSRLETGLWKRSMSEEDEELEEEQDEEEWEEEGWDEEE